LCDQVYVLNESVITWVGVYCGYVWHMNVLVFFQAEDEEILHKCAVTNL